MKKIEIFLKRNRSLIITWSIGISLILLMLAMHDKPDKFIRENDIVTWDELQFHLYILGILAFCSFLTRKELFWSERQEEWATQMTEKIEQLEKDLVDLKESSQNALQKKRDDADIDDFSWPTISTRLTDLKGRVKII